MALRLTIISDQAGELGELATKVIDHAGGSIGRADDNEWVLPDPLRYISAHHARILYRNGAYIVEDTSTNGLFLNDDPEPVGRLGPQPLRSGDTLRLGAYRIGVHDNDTPVADASAIVSFSAPPSAADADGMQRDIGVDLNISELLVNDAELSAARRAFDPWGNPVTDSAVLRFDHAQQAARRTQAAPAAPAATAAVAPAPGPRPAGAPQPHSGSAPGPGAARALDAFCRGAGVDSARLPGDGRDRLLQLAGLLLREALVGAKELARTQREIRQSSGLRAVADEPERAALQSLPVEDLLVRLLVGHEKQQLDAVQWLRELFGLASRHDAALMRALRPALAEFTQRLDPSQLSPGTPASDRFRSITEMPEGRLPHLFAESLARHFNAEIGAGADEG